MKKQSKKKSSKKRAVGANKVERVEKALIEGLEKRSPVAADMVRQMLKSGKLEII